MGIGLIQEFNCLGVASSQFLGLTLTCMGIPGPSVSGSYTLQDEGGVSVTHNVHLALGWLPNHGGYSPSLQVAGLRLGRVLVTFDFRDHASRFTNAPRCLHCQGTLNFPTLASFGGQAGQKRGSPFDR